MNKIELHFLNTRSHDLLIVSDYRRHLLTLAINYIESFPSSERPNVIDQLTVMKLISEYHARHNMYCVRGLERVLVQQETLIKTIKLYLLRDYCEPQIKDLRIN